MNGAQGNAARSDDSVTVEVIRHKVENIADEMQVTLLRSAFSSIVKEAMDCSAALFTASGETLAQATAMPIHLAAMTPALASVLSAYPSKDMVEGDVYLLNDPYHGGTHLPDITLFMPIFHEGELYAFSASTVHHQDVGGMWLGSMPTNATEVFQEGLRLPPLKLFEAGKLNETLDKILRLNSRTPTDLMGDIYAQFSACTVGKRRLEELRVRYGVLLLKDVFTKLLDRSEAMTRAVLEGLPEGTYSSENWLDDDGIDLGQKIKIKVAVTLKNGTIHFDLTGTDPQTRGPINCVPGATHAAAYYVTRAMVGPGIPTNGGCFRPISMTLPSGSLVNPVAPASVNSRSSTIKRVCTAMIAALGEAVPQHVSASPGSELVCMVFGGKRQDGQRFVISELFTSGTGASARSDGVDCLQSDGTNGKNVPIEAFMADAPIVIKRFELRRDSGGAGLHRGGLGVVREYEFLVDDIQFTYRGERHLTPAQGMLGGHAGATADAHIIRAGGEVEKLPSKCVGVLSKGDRLIVETAAGGGYGSPAERDRMAVSQDVANGKVSAAAAEAAYR